MRDCALEKGGCDSIGREENGSCFCWGLICVEYNSISCCERGEGEEKRRRKKKLKIYYYLPMLLSELLKKSIDINEYFIRVSSMLTRFNFRKGQK